MATTKKTKSRNVKNSVSARSLKSVASVKQKQASHSKTKQKPVAKKISTPAKSSKKQVSKKAPQKALKKPVVKAAKKQNAKPAISKSKKELVLKPAKKVLPKKKDSAKKVAKKVISKTSTMKKSSTPAKAEAKSKKSAEKKPAKSKKIDDVKSEKLVASKPEKTKTNIKEILEKHGSKKSAAEVIAKILESKNAVKPSKKSAPVVEVATAKVAVRASAGIFFSIEDVDNFLNGKAMTKTDEKYSQSVAATAIERKKSAKRIHEQVVVQVPKRPLAAASIADILGFNPIEQSRTVYEEKDVPQKWKKYYKLLLETKERLLNGTNKADMVASDNGELSHENSTQGMDVADIGSKNFERDMVFNLLSAEQNIISEVNAAIERMRNGTYGVCEVTGKPIPESRLLALPFARCTIEGQKQKEIESRRMKSGAKRDQFGVDIQDDFSSSEISEDGE